MIARQSKTNNGNIEFYKEPELIELPLWEFSKLQLETHKSVLELELAKVNEMLSFFS